MTQSASEQTKEPGNCKRCGQNHYDMTRPRVPTCPFKPQRTGPGGQSDPDIIAMARLAQHDERYSTGALYGALADEITRLRAERPAVEKMADAMEELIALAETTFPASDLLDARIALDEWRALHPSVAETGGEKS